MPKLRKQLKKAFLRRKFLPLGALVCEVIALLMDKGIIVERGTHDELYAKNGAYCKLCDMQRTN